MDFLGLGPNAPKYKVVGFMRNTSRGPRPIKHTPRLKEGWVNAGSPLSDADQRMLDALLEGVLENNAVKFSTGIHILSEEKMQLLLDEDTEYCIYSPASNNHWLRGSLKGICDAFVENFATSKTFKKWDHVMEKLVSMRSRVATLLLDAFLSAWAKSTCRLAFEKVMPLVAWSVSVVCLKHQELAPLPVIPLWREDLAGLIRQRSCRAYALTCNLAGFLKRDATIGEIMSSVNANPKTCVWCECEYCHAKSVTPSWRPHILARLPRWSSPCGCEREPFESDSNSGDSNSGDSELGDVVASTEESDSSSEGEGDGAKATPHATTLRRRREMDAALRREAQAAARRNAADTQRRIALAAEAEDSAAARQRRREKAAAAAQAAAARKAADKQRGIALAIEEKVHTVAWLAVQNVLKAAKAREREAKAAHEKKIKALRATNGKAAEKRLRAAAEREKHSRR